MDYLKIMFWDFSWFLTLFKESSYSTVFWMFRVTNVVAKTAIVVGATILARPVGIVAVTSITTGEVAVDIADGDYTAAAIDAGF